MATTTRKAATEEDLLRTPKDGSTYELVDGEIRVSPGGVRHGAVSLRLAARLHSFVTEREVRELDATDELDGEDVVPGFRCTLSDILA